MSECDQNHDECRSGSVCWEEMPSRLLDVRSSHDMVQLVDRQDIVQHHTTPPPYITLSYRWGTVGQHSQRRVLLTKETAPNLRRGIHIRDLPATLRDACIITSRLQYQYLWIDRLCIFQDSAVDWAAEAGTMAATYKHAQLNIHASCAAGEDAGCFRDRTITRAGIQPLLLPRGMKS